MINILSLIKKYSSILLLIAIVILAAIILKDCNQPAPSDSILVEQKALVDTFNLREDTYKRTIRAISEKANHFEATSINQKKKLVDLEKKLTVEERRSSQLIYDMKEAKYTNDSLLFEKKCDTLAEQVPTLISINQGYRYQVDSLLTTHREQIIYKDSIINTMEGFNSDMRSAFTQLQNINTKIVLDNKQLQKQAARDKRKTKFIALGGAVIAGLLIAK